MHAYGFDLNSLIFFYSYIENHNQNFTLNDTYSLFQILLSDVPQGISTGPHSIQYFYKWPTNEYQKLRTTYFW